MISPVILLALSSSALAKPHIGLGGLPHIRGQPGGDLVDALPFFFPGGPILQNNEEINLIPGGPVRQAPAGSEVCLTKGCVKAADNLNEAMDETADPCTSFYQFACGGFLKNTVIPDHQTSRGSFSIVRDNLNERLRKLFEEEAAADEPKVYESVRNLYKSCVDTDTIEEQSLKDLKVLVAEIGGWPVVEGESWVAGDEWKWWDLSMRASDAGFSSDRMISVGIGSDAKDSTKRILEIDQPSLGLSREYLIKGIEDKDVQAYYDYMVSTAVFMGADKEAAKTEMKEALEFELKIAAITLPKEERRNKTALYNMMTLKKASDYYPALPWVKYVNVILDVERKVTVDDTELVNVAVPKYLKEFKDFIDTVPARTIANLIMWRNVRFAFSYLGKDALDIQLKFSKALTGKAKQSPRWERCVKATAGIGGNYFYFYEGSLTNAVGAMYAKKYFQENAKDIADEMVENIRTEFKIMLDELTWMDKKTKNLAHKKADKITPYIGYAKEILEDKLINDFYEGFSLSKDSYFGNILYLRKYLSTYYAKEFRNPIDKKSWKTHGGAAIVNAFYNPAENSITFPAGILDGVFFDADRPLYMNYGAIGMVVGHEITHGFDDQGAQKDGDGNLVNWWEKQTKEKYLERSQCIIDQYANYTVEVDGEVLNLNGINTQGENIADNGGTREAYFAYERLVKKYGLEPILPSLQYSQKQLFWLSTAQVWCSTKRPASLKNQVLTDPHSPTEFRVDGPFSNMPEFARDWGCPLGSHMNPVKKCTVW